MIIDKSKITGTRLMFAIAFFLQSSALLTAFLAGVTKHESWIPVVIGFIICVPLVFLFRSIMMMFPDKNFLQVLEVVFGKALGKILGAGMLWFFLHLTALNVLDLGDFMKISFLPETPHYVLTLSCLLLAVWGVRNGFGVVSRYGSLFTVIEFLIVGISIIFLSNQMDMSNFFPLFTQPVMKYVQGVHIATVIPMGEIVIFLMVTPCVEKISKKKMLKYWLLGVVMGVSVLLVVMLRDISILGNALHIFSLPGLVTMRLVNFGEALSRMEIIFSVAVIMLLFFKITVLVYVSTIALSQLFGTTHYKHLALVVAIFVFVYSPTLYNNNIEHSHSAHAFEPFVNTLFEVVVPLGTYIFAKIRGLPRSERAVAVRAEE